ncbi:succinylglutamate desuccinylase/aspartoacylase family protein [Paraburkholderia caribensis]|uniref:succinylglutamate desuccinylase/aspartoacylase family protein n=1 Tax=Paraburkholderia caribensis TaxID=75105 RepID=UPI00078D70C2|nr:succinylglutamate desuccinylase/aspartoacylase family protein [Paraburkholderia caribensis]AMV41761.1 hypothetical protein ATN79_03560 [Paraburkholderia caribensis]
MKTIALENFSIEDIPRGTTERGYFSVGGGDTARMPFTVVRSDVPGPLVLITAGVHAAEYTAIEAAMRLSRSSLELRSGALVVVPIVNSRGFILRSIGINPSDGKNINRVFPGCWDGTESDRLAYVLFQRLVLASDYFIDMHSGDSNEDLSPFAFFHESSVPAKFLATQFGLPYMVGTEQPGFSCVEASRHGIPSILVEAGRSGRVEEAHVEQLLSGVRRVMCSIGMMGESLAETYPSPRELKLEVVRARFSGLWYPELKAGDVVRKGEALGRLTTLLGDESFVPMSTGTGRVLFFVNSLAVNEGDVLCAFGKSEDDEW